MKSIMITGPSSNAGKTTLTLGIIRSIRNRSMDISAFKTGPDFIDSKYLGLAAGKTAANLDMHMMGQEGLKKSLYLNSGEIAVVEGAMGYFDGISNTYLNSSYDISRELDIPAILVYTPKGEMFSAIPKIKGMADFPASKIEAVILNQVNPMVYKMMKEQIEEYTGLKVLGYLDKKEELRINSYNLGLRIEDEEGDRLIDEIAEIVEETVDIDAIIDLARDVEVPDYEFPEGRGFKMGIARDRVFEFNYSENIKLLERVAEIEYFSPLEDEELGDYDLVYIGTGYIEEELDKLSANRSMMESIRDYVEAGGYLIAEGSGLMYLTESLEDRKLVAIFKGESRMTDRLARFGYVNLEFQEDTIYGPAGSKLYGNEYHKSEVDLEDRTIIKVTKPRSKRSWSCGYRYKNCLAYYQHINFLGNMEAFENLVKEMKKENM